MDHCLAHTLRKFLTGALIAALALPFVPADAASDATGKPDSTLKVVIPNPEATRQTNDPTSVAARTVLDQQLARDTDATAPAVAATANTPKAIISAPMPGNAMANNATTPLGPMQKFVRTLVAPLSASLSAMDSMLSDTHHIAISMADQWVQSQKPADTQYASAAPQAPAAPAPAATATRTAYQQDPAAAVFADNSQPVVVYYPPVQQAGYYPPQQPYYPPQQAYYPPQYYPQPYYYPPQPYYYPPQGYYPPPAPAYAPPAAQPAQVIMAPAPAPAAQTTAQYSVPLAPASGYVQSAAAMPAAPIPPAPQKPHAIITVSNSSDATFIVHRSSTGGSMPNSVVPPAVRPEDYAQLAPAAGTDDPMQPIAAGPATPAAAPAAAPAPAGPSVFEATVSGPGGTKSNTAAAPAPLLPSEGTEPEPALSPDTKKVLSHIPSGINSTNKETEHLAVNHEKEAPVAGKSAGKGANLPMDASVDTAKPHVDVQYDLQQGYGALVAGDTEAAIRIYTNVLENDPDNKQALFALGTAYQRVGQIDKARPYYVHLLKVDPSNRNALNNFLALAADEAPQDALRELQDLQKRNPNFSPVLAQIAYIYEKQGMTDQAIENMLHAVAMEPENLTYRYNLAVMYDKAGKNQEAVELYRQVVAANYRGEHVPGSIERVQERLTFLSSNSPK